MPSRVPCWKYALLAIAVVGTGALPMAEAQVFSRGGEVDSRGAEVAYVFDPRMDDTWQETGMWFAEAISLDAWPIHLPYGHLMEQEDDRIRLSLSVGEDTHIPWQFPIAAKQNRGGAEGSPFGVPPESLPKAVTMQYAHHHNGYGVRNGTPATVTVFGPPGSFSSFGPGADGVRGIAAAVGVPVAPGAEGDFEVSEERLEAAKWRDWIGMHQAIQGARLYYGGIGEIAIYCDCTRVTIHTPGVGETLNRVVGFYDTSGAVFLVHMTPWADIAAMDLLAPERLEEEASRLVNGTSGRPVSSAELTSYDLYLPRKGDLTLAAYVDVHTPRIDGVKTSWTDVALDPVDGRLISYGGTVSSSGYAPFGPWLPTLVGVIALLFVRSRWTGPAPRSR